MPFAKVGPLLGEDEQQLKEACSQPPVIYLQYKKSRTTWRRKTTAPFKTLVEALAQDAAMNSALLFKDLCLEISRLGPCTPQWAKASNSLLLILHVSRLVGKGLHVIWKGLWGELVALNHFGSSHPAVPAFVPASFYPLLFDNNVDC